MNKKQKKVCRALNYIDLSLFVISTITGCVSISVFAFLVRIARGTAISTIGIKYCVITAGINKYKSIIRKRRSMIK